MNRIALKMLMGDRAKFLGIVLGLTFAALLITQQASIFVGLMTRAYTAINDVGLPDIWVMDANVRTIDLDGVKPMPDTMLSRVRSVEGVQWAVPHYRALLNTRLDSGRVQGCLVIGLDDASLIGGPAIMVQGTLADLKREDSVIVDEVGAHRQFARTDPMTGAKIPLKVGDNLELNDHRAVVVGICQASRSFIFAPQVYTTYSRALRYAPTSRKMLSYVLVSAKPGEDRNALCVRIASRTGLIARTQAQFREASYHYFFTNTGIPINFGISVLLGFLVGTAIAGQTFFNFTHDNLKQFGALKAMGATNGMLLRMILMQAALVGFIGYGLGVGLAALFGLAVQGTELAFRMPWQLLFISAVAVAGICMLSAALAIRTVFKLEPAIVFKG